MNFFKLPPLGKTMILCLLDVCVTSRYFRAGDLLCIWGERSPAWTHPTVSTNASGFWHIFFSASTRPLADAKIFAPQTPTASHQGNLSNSIYPARCQLRH